MRARRAKQSHTLRLRSLSRGLEIASGTACPRNDGRGIFRLLAMTIALLLPNPLSIQANPEFSHTEHGSIGIEQQGSEYNIYSSDRSIGAFRYFGNNLGEIINSIQASQDHSVLFRVIGADPSVFYGTFNANSRVFLLNPNGIIFGAGSQVNAPALVASTLSMTNEDFLAGHYRFEQDLSRMPASIFNQGEIVAEKGGYIALLGGAVQNTGVLRAEEGSVALGAGGKMTLGVDPEGLVSLVIDEPVRSAVYDLEGHPINDAILNEGAIAAHGGRVLLSVEALEEVFDNVINHKGSIEAQSVSLRNGEIILNGGEEGLVRVSGVLDASGKEDGETGGSVRIFGEKVGLIDEALIDVSGHRGGGSVSIRSTSRTYVGEEVEVRADALTEGSGGRVITWSDDATAFYGKISARGGAHSGDGGFVEVSGHEHLQFQGVVDAEAPQGARGTLLLDPKNITVVAGLAGLLSALDQFLDNPALSDTIGVLTMALSVVDILFQANNDITVSAAITGLVAGVDLTFQAGRSITINSNITTNNGAINFTANETLANGVQNANRDAGAAAITMADGTTINAGNQNITLTVSTGAGLTNSTSGDITLENLTTTGHVLVVNNGPTAGSGILRTSSDALITASSAAFDVAGAGGSGEIGTLANPIRLTVSNIEARAQSGGVFLNSPSTATTIGGATLGGLTGLSTSAGNGNISFTTTDATITDVTEAISANGSGTVALTAAGATRTLQASAAISSTSGAIALTATDGVTLNGASADVITTGSYTVDADSNDNGTGNYSQNNAGSAVSAGAISVTANDITLTGTLNSGASSTTLLVSDGGTIGLGDTAGNYTLSGTELQNITATGLTLGDATNGSITVNNISAANSNNISGTLTLNATQDNASISFATTASTFNALTANADDGITVSVNLTTDTGALTLEGDADNTADTNDNISLGANLTSAGTLTLDATTGDVDLTAATVLTATNSNLLINDTIDGAQTLALDSGTGDITLSAAIGASTALSSLTMTGNDISLVNIGGGAAGVTGATSLTATGSITFNGTTYRANQQTYTAPSGNTFLINSGATTSFLSTDDAITFNTGTILLSNGSDLIINSGGGAISVNGGIRGTSSEDVTITSTGGTTNTVSVGAIGSGNEINTVAINATTITLNGDITTSDAAGNTVTLTGNVLLGTDLTIDTDNAGVDGDITITGTTNGAQALTIVAGTANVSFNGDVGAAIQLADLAILSAGSVFFGGVVLTGGVLTITLTAGNLTYSVTRNLTVALARALNGRVTLTSAGSILSLPGGAARIVALEGIRLISGGVIGTITNPVRTHLLGNGSIFLSALGAIDGLSIHLTGNVLPSLIHLLNNPPGLVVYNGSLLGGRTLPLLERDRALLNLRSFREILLPGEKETLRAEEPGRITEYAPLLNREGILEAQKTSFKGRNVLLEAAGSGPGFFSGLSFPWKTPTAYAKPAGLPPLRERVIKPFREEISHVGERVQEKIQEKVEPVREKAVEKIFSVDGRLGKRLEPVEDRANFLKDKVWEKVEPVLEKIRPLQEKLGEKVVGPVNEQLEPVRQKLAETAPAGVEAETEIGPEAISANLKARLLDQELERGIEVRDARTGKTLRRLGFGDEPAVLNLGLDTNPEKLAESLDLEDGTLSMHEVHGFDTKEGFAKIEGGALGLNTDFELKIGEHRLIGKIQDRLKIGLASEKESEGEIHIRLRDEIISFDIRDQAEVTLTDPNGEESKFFFAGGIGMSDPLALGDDIDTSLDLSPEGIQAMLTGPGGLFLFMIVGLPGGGGVEPPPVVLPPPGALQALRLSGLIDFEGECRKASVEETQEFKKILEKQGKAEFQKKTPKQEAKKEKGEEAEEGEYAVCTNRDFREEQAALSAQKAVASLLFAQPELAPAGLFSGRAVPAPERMRVESLSYARDFIKELSPLKAYAKKPLDSSVPIAVKGATDREIFFQAFTLFHKTNRLSFEQSRELAEEPKIPPSQEIKPLHVWQVLDASSQRLEAVKQRFEIPAERKEKQEMATQASSDELFSALLQANRQVNALLEKEYSVADSFQQVTLALDYASRLLDQFPGADQVPVAAPLEPRRHLGDVRDQLVKCNEIIREIAGRSGVKMMRVKAEKMPSGSLNPGDIYDMASLAASQLAYLHSLSSGADPPYGAYPPGEKSAADVYQRVVTLENQLNQLKEQVEANPNWQQGKNGR